MNKAAMRTLDILTYVSGSRRPVTPKAISEALNIPLAGTNDILDTMVRMEYLMQPDKVSERLPWESGLLKQERPTYRERTC
mgnify:CR=1 FL=1